MDGAQAFSLTMCSKRVRLADATWRRMSYVPSAIRNARGQNETRLGWAHPAKSLAPTQARAVSSQYVGSLDHTLRLARSTVPRCWVPRRLSYACDLPAYLPTCLPATGACGVACPRRATIPTAAPAHLCAEHGGLAIWRRRDPAESDRDNHYGQPYVVNPT